MAIYFTDSQIPELAGLTPQQRRVVRVGALAALSSQRPSARWSVGLLAGSFAGGMAVAGNGVSHFVTADHKLLIMIAFGLAGAVVGGIIGAQLLTAQLRPYFRQFLEEHKSEIAQINKPT